MAQKGNINVALTAVVSCAVTGERLSWSSCRCDLLEQEEEEDEEQEEEEQEGI